jgi:hypothetical protein
VFHALTLPQTNGPLESLLTRALLAPVTFLEKDPIEPMLKFFLEAPLLNEHDTPAYSEVMDDVSGWIRKPNTFPQFKG